MSAELCPRPAEDFRSAEPKPHLAIDAMPSGVRFVDDATRDAICAGASVGRCIVLRPRADRYGGLARAIDADFESALAVRGALPAPFAVEAHLADALDDQLRRARMLPAPGVCLALPGLAGATDAELVLAAEDARYLTAFMRAAWSSEEATPVLVLLAESDRQVALPVPRTLDALVLDEIERIDLENEHAFDASDILVSALLQSSSEEDLAIPDLVALSTATGDVDESDFEPEEEPAIAAAPIAETLRPTVPDHGTETESASETETDSETETAAATASDTESATETANDAKLEAQAVRRAEAARAAQAARDAHAREIAAREAEAREAEAQEARRAQRMLLASAARAHAVELDAAQGPKPVSAIERLFAQHYVPLVGAMHRGEADAISRGVGVEWSRAFAESYCEAFSTIRVTGKRPTMVFDAFDVATRIARLSSARNVKLVMIDSMSFDLGERVAARMKTELDKRAVHVERSTLWSALPSRTPTQLQLLSRGPDGLKDNAPLSSSEPDVSRGRSLTTMRRERLGNRELMKLDLVEARLHSPGAAYDERLDALADEVTDLVVMFMETLQPRTLLYVFGDHGFILGPGANGWATGPAQQGGASPDEVLVSGHAWLVDAMQ